jgi:hypothetical protein
MKQKENIFTSTCDYTLLRVKSHTELEKYFKFLQFMISKENRSGVKDRSCLYASFWLFLCRLTIKRLFTLRN